MAPVSITAHFPLGVYHGHAADGRSEPFPSPTRLLSALVNAAHIGTTAPGDGTAKPQYAAALTWLEEHPPNGFCLPTTMNVRMGESRIFMHRRNGCIENNKSQFLRELHFIEATRVNSPPKRQPRRSSFGNCTSLRHVLALAWANPPKSQFFRELHFIEARRTSSPRPVRRGSQFFRELHFIEVGGDWCTYCGRQSPPTALCASPSRPAWPPPGRRAGRRACARRRRGSSPGPGSNAAWSGPAPPESPSPGAHDWAG